MLRIETSDIQEFEIRHQDDLRELAPECTVLLKKNGNFPLKEPCKIALYGSGARLTIKGGTGSGDVNVRTFQNIEKSLELAGFSVTTKEWLDQYEEIRKKAHLDFVKVVKQKAIENGIPAFFAAMGAVMPEPEYNLPLKAAGKTAVYVLARISGEGSDRKNQAGDFKLTETEKRDILHLAAKHDNFLLVLNVGGVVDLSEILEVPNILLLSQLGTVTGSAFTDLLLGKRYPSGKLTSTWAAESDYSHVGDFGIEDDVRYKEGLYVGYRYFDSIRVEPLFPFGFGLGYTDFTISCVNIKVKEHQIQASTIVRNVGSYSGKEVVQLYYSAPGKEEDRPFQELGTFDKTRELMPGEEETITLTLPIENMASYSTGQAERYLEAGKYTIRIGCSSRDTTICGILELDKRVVTEKLKNAGGIVDFKDWVPPIMPPAPHPKNIPIISINSEKLKGIGFSEHLCRPLADHTPTPETLSVESFSNEELGIFCVGKYTEAAGFESIIGSGASTVAGAGGETADILKQKGFGKIVMADGPAGLRISSEYVLQDQGAVPNAPGNLSMYLEFLEEDLQQKLSQKTAATLKKNASYMKYYQFCSAVPVGTAIAQSWNTKLCRRIGKIIGKEMKIFGVHLWLAPALNIHRSPLCGRNFEYFSEDPVLSGKIAAAITLGVQAHPGCGVTIKHFACNNQETNRFYSNSMTSERALREIYLKGFEIAVKESHPIAVMTSYNLLNGEHTCNRKDLITEILRGEWGFNGIVMTDWLATGGGFFTAKKYPSGSASGCIAAGNDLIMPGSEKDLKDILASLENSSTAYPITRNMLKECAQRIIRVVKILSK